MYDDLKIRSVENIKDLTNMTKYDLQRTQEPDVELELCKSHEEYVQWRLKENISTSCPKSLVKLSDICKMKKLF